MSKVSQFLNAAKSQPELASQVDAIFAEAATSLAGQLSALSQGTPHAFAPQDVFSARALDDGQLERVSGAGFLDDVNYQGFVNMMMSRK